MNGMTTTIDAAGRLVIPRDIRNAIGLRPGATVEISVEDGVITIQPAPMRVKVVKKGRLHILVAEDDLQPLTEDAVRAVRDELRSGGR